MEIDYNKDIGFNFNVAGEVYRDLDSLTLQVGCFKIINGL